MSKVLKPIHGHEQLSLIDLEQNEKKKKMLLAEFGAKSPLNFILSLNFNDGVQLDLPEGMPEISPNHLDSLTNDDFMGLLASSISRVRHCSTKSDLTRTKKENIFYEVLINCPLKDAEILCSAKDKALEELYPTITAEFVASVFPSYVVSFKGNP